MDLRASEIRVLGCLLEKQRTTPDAYPLTLNGLRLACNQATNRDPLVDYDDDVIREAVHRLERRGYARLASGAGSRAPKFRHLLRERIPLSDGEQSILCVLMLRGAQTPGELKQRTERLHHFVDLDDVDSALGALAARDLVERQERRAGHKEQRFAHTLAADGPEGERAPTPAVRPRPSAGGHEPQSPPTEGHDAALEERVARLEHEIAELRHALGGP